MKLQILVVVTLVLSGAHDGFAQTFGVEVEGSAEHYEDPFHPDDTAYPSLAQMEERARQDAKSIAERQCDGIAAVVSEWEFDQEYSFSEFVWRVWAQATFLCVPAEEL